MKWMKPGFSSQAMNQISRSTAKPNCSEAPFRRQFTIARAMFEWGGQGGPQSRTKPWGRRLVSFPSPLLSLQSHIPAQGGSSQCWREQAREGWYRLSPVPCSTAGLGWAGLNLAEPCWSLGTAGVCRGSLGWFGGVCPPAEAWRVLWAW